jgi:lysozyme family protein
MLENLSMTITAFVFPDEGGFVVRDTEPGGAGNLGISFTVFKQWWMAKGRPRAPTFDDLRALTKADAVDVYTIFFATPLHFADLPGGVDYCVLDSGINDGTHASVALLQQALKLHADGKFTPGALAAAKAANPTDLINAHCDLCLERKQANPEWPRFGKGWTNRIAKRRTRALAMIGATS